VCKGIWSTIPSLKIIETKVSTYYARKNHSSTTLISVLTYNFV
jgi:hypothetical protein